MTHTITLDELLGWTADERAKWLPLTPRDVVVQSGTSPTTPRKLLCHMALHEVRHWAQIAAIVRLAGIAPPGDHDLFYSQALL